MRTKAICAVMLIPIGGCSSDLSKYFPTAPAAFSADLKAERTLEGQLLTAQRNEDRTLIYLSRGFDRNPYGCGKPNDPRFLQIKKDDANTSKAVKNAEDVLDAYQAALTKIQNADKSFNTAIADLKTVVDAGSKIPGVSAYVAPVQAGLPLLNDIGSFIAVGAVRQLALNMVKPLQGAVTTLKRNKTALEGGELLAFQLWDECARETLAYIRDVPIGKVPNYASFISQSTGVELKTAFNDYLTQKAALQKLSPDLDAALQAILDQNNALINGSPLNLTGLISALSDASNFAKSVNSSVGAI